MNVMGRAARKSQVRQCLDFCTSYFGSSLAYESAEQKHCLTWDFLSALLIHLTFAMSNDIAIVSAARTPIGEFFPYLTSDWISKLIRFKNILILWIKGFDPDPNKCKVSWIRIQRWHVESDIHAHRSWSNLRRDQKSFLVLRSLL